MRKFLLLVLSICFVVGMAAPRAQVVGGRVRLESQNPQGVPVHPAAGDNNFVRWTNGTIGRIVALDAAMGWIQVDSAGKRGWVTGTYVTVLPPDLLDRTKLGPKNRRALD
jgi:hypothetical protein